MGQAGGVAAGAGAHRATDTADALARIPGAIVVDGVLQHVGNPLTEQRALAEGRALAPLGECAVIAVPGPDRLSWLDSLSTQKLTGLRPGQGVELLILDPKGHVQFAAAAIEDGQTTWLVTERAGAAGLLHHLRAMRFRLRVDPRAADGELAVVGGTDAAVQAVTAAAPAGVPLRWRDPWPGITDGGWAYATAVGHPGQEWDFSLALVEGREERRLLAAARRGEQAVAGSLSVDALRIAAWRPRLGDVDDRTIPHEFDWLRTAVHMNKGCYRGQETVSKVHNLGHPPRRLVALQLDGSQSLLPAQGDPVRDGDTQVGVVVAAALHHEEGPIALALVRRTTPVDAPLTVEAAGGVVAAAQEVIVPVDAGAVASVPRLPRLGARRR